MKDHPRNRPTIVLLYNPSQDFGGPLSEALERNGYRVYSVVTADDVTRRARRLPRPDIILLQGYYAGSEADDGITITKQLKTKPETSDIPVVLLESGEDWEEIGGGATREQRATSAGVAAIYELGVMGINTLIETIQRAMNPANHLNT